jgi:hypothetical protein
MSDFFEEVITNPAEWDDSGLLKLRRRTDPSGPQHQCKIGCSPNMCKGLYTSYVTALNERLTRTCRGRARGIFESLWLFIRQSCVRWGRIQ